VFAGNNFLLLRMLALRIFQTTLLSVMIDTNCCQCKNPRRPPSWKYYHIGRLKKNLVFAGNNFLLLRIFALKIFQTTHLSAMVDLIYECSQHYTSELYGELLVYFCKNY